MVLLLLRLPHLILNIAPIGGVSSSQHLWSAWRCFLLILTISPGLRSHHVPTIAPRLIDPRRNTLILNPARRVSSLWVFRKLYRDSRHHLSGWRKLFHGGISCKWALCLKGIMSSILVIPLILLSPLRHGATILMLPRLRQMAQIWILRMINLIHGLTLLKASFDILILSFIVKVLWLLVVVKLLGEARSTVLRVIDVVALRILLMFILWWHVFWYPLTK